MTTTQAPRRAAAGLAALAALAVAAPAAHAKPAPRPVAARLQAILDRSVKGAHAEFPGVELYVRAPGWTWAGAAGKARLHPGAPMRPGYRFRAGSIMKTFVAAATLQLVEEGRLSLDDPLPAVLPHRVIARFAGADRITVRMLLNHTSGLGSYTDDPNFEREVANHPRKRWTTAELLDRAAARPRTGAPGEHYAYSNTNYNLLGLIIQHVTGKPWRAVIRQRIFRPLHLRHSSLPRPGHIPAGRGIAHGYQRIGGKLYDLTRVDSSMAGAAGGHALLTTTKDLARFNDALLAGRLFRHAQTLREMRTFVPAQDHPFEVGYGLGLERDILPGGVEMLGNMGDTAGYRAFMYRLPAQHVDVAMAINEPGDPSPALVPVLQLLLGA